MKIAVIEDSETDRLLLIDYIFQYSQEKHLSLEGSITPFENGETFLKYFSKNYNIIFIDIFMKEINGLETAKEIRKADEHCSIIFTTVSPDYAREGYNVQASHYLLKPFTYSEFKKTMDTCKIEALEQSYFLEIKNRTSSQPIMINDIIFADTYNRHVQIHLSNGNIVKCNMPFSQFAEQLMVHAKFLDCNRGIIVNMTYIQKAGTDHFLLKNGCTIPIRKLNRCQIRDHYLKYSIKQLERRNT